MEEAGVRGKVCVTGGEGFVGSWVVKILLSKGYIVHGTVRDSGDEITAHLKKMENAADNLHLFKVDLLDYDAMAAAIAGCEGVIHVASPCPAGKVLNPEVEVIAPAVTGTLNVLKACSEAKVKRVVVVSSGSSIIENPNWPKDSARDESCWSDEEYCITNEDWYSLSKTLAESKAHDYAKKYGLDVVTLCPVLILGPLLQSVVNASSLLLLSLVKGEPESTKNQPWPAVDVRDVAAALILLYEKPDVSGRYICASHHTNFRDIVSKLKSKYPNYKYPKEFIEVDKRREVTAEKLRMLGWNGRMLEETLTDSIESYRNAGLLDKN